MTRTDVSPMIPADLHARLVENGRAQAANLREGGEGLDLVPVVKLFTPEGAATWLLTEIDPEDPCMAFGLADLGMGFPELGWIYLPELEAYRTPRLGLPIERDLWFAPAGRTLPQFAAEARAAGRIVA